MTPVNHPIKSRKLLCLLQMNLNKCFQIKSKKPEMHFKADNIEMRRTRLHLTHFLNSLLVHFPLLCSWHAELGVGVEWALVLFNSTALSDFTFLFYFFSICSFLIHLRDHCLATKDRTLMIILHTCLHFHQHLQYCYLCDAHSKIKHMLECCLLLFQGSGSF